MPGKLAAYRGKRLSEDEARAILGPKPVREEGESIASYNKRLGKSQRDYQTLVSGVSAKERAAAARTPGLTDEQAQYVWWNGPNEQDTPGFQFQPTDRPAAPPPVPRPTDRDPNAGKYDLTPALLNPLGLQTANTRPRPAAPIISGAADLARPPVAGPVATRPSQPGPANPAPVLGTTPTPYSQPAPTKPKQRPFTMGGLFQ